MNGRGSETNIRRGPCQRRVRRRSGAGWRCSLRSAEARHDARLAGCVAASGQDEVADYRCDMVRGIERVQQITFGLLLVAGCSEGDAESSTSTTGGTTSDGGSSSGGSSSSTTGGGSAPTGTEGESETAGQDTGSTDTTDTTVTTGETGTPGGPGFAVDIWPIFDASCSCHKDSGGAGMLRLGSDDAYANLVDKPSKQAKMMMLVAPGSAEDSYLWNKF